MKRKCKHCKSTHIYVSDIGKDEYEFVCMDCYTYYDEKFKIKKTILKISISIYGINKIKVALRL